MLDDAEAFAAWPHGTGHMAHLVRTHDWTASPIGPVDEWPQSLRTAVDMMLAMPGPATILWGAASVQIYNDAYRDIARDRHPQLLGRPVAEGWPEAYASVVAPLLESTRAGQAVRLTEYPVRLKGDAGQLEKRFFDTDWTPIRDEKGAVAGTLQTLVDVTARRCADAVLRESEARHRLLIGSWAQAVWETDAGGVVIADSASWRAYTGQTVEQWLGYGWLDAIHPEDRACAERQWREGVAAQVLVNAEFRLRAPGGGWRWTNVRAAPVRDPDGNVEKWAGMNIDIDAAKAAEAALRDSESKYRTLFETMCQGYQECVVIRDANGCAVDHRVIEANPRSVELTGIPRDTMLAHTANELFPDALGFWTSTFDRIVRKGEPEHLEHDVAPLGRWYDVHVYPKGDDYFLLLFDDTTRRKHAEQALRRSEERQRVLIEGVPQLVWRARDAGHWTWASPQWTEFTGQSKEDSRDWGWLAPLHPEDRDVARTAWACAEDDGRFTVEYRIRDRSSGRYRWFQTRATPFRDDYGNVIEWLGTSTDIDDLRRLQERQQVLVEELQHRTFNLMGMVRSTADMTIRSSTGLPDFRERFRDRIEALARAQRLLSRLRDDQRVTFSDLIHAELDATGALDSDRRQVTLEGPHDVLLRSSNVQTLAMALHELTTNAVKYGALGQSGAHLHVRWWVEERAGGRACLRIDWRETGVAMPAANAAPRGTGQGRLLIEKALPYQLQAETTYVMAADGVHCSIALPVSSRGDVEVYDATHELPCTDR